MIYLIVGASRAGKTTFTENTFLRGRDNHEYRDIFTLTENDEYILFGKYGVEDRRKGTDTTNRKDITKYYEQIERLKEKNKDIVLEGTRLSTKLFMQLFLGGYECKLFWIYSSPEKILERNREKGNEQTTSHFVAEATKAKYMFWKYAQLFDGEIIDTNWINNSEDWERLEKGTECSIKRSDTIDFARYFADYIYPLKKMHEAEDFASCFLNVITNPSFVKVKSDGSFESIVKKENAIPRIINEKWKKNA